MTVEEPGAARPAAEERGHQVFSRQRLLAALRAFVLGRAFQVGASLLLTLSLVRILETEAYAIYMALWGFVTMAGLATTLGLRDALKRYLPQLLAEGARAGPLRFVLAMGAVRLALLLAACAGIHATWSGMGAWLGLAPVTDTQLAAALALFVAHELMTLAMDVLECMLEQRQLQAARALFTLARLAGLVLLLSLARVSVDTLLQVDLAAATICLLLTGRAAAHTMGALAPRGTFRPRTGDVLAFAWHMAGVNLLQAVSGPGAQRVLAVKFLGFEAAAAFAFLQQVQLLAGRYMPAQLSVNLLRPMLVSRRAAGRSGDVTDALALVSKANLLTVALLIVTLLAVGDPLLALASGGRFPDVGVIATIMFVGLGAMNQQVLVNTTLQIFDRTRALRAQSLTSLLFPLFAWAGSAHGLAGFVAAIALLRWGRVAFSTWWMRKEGLGLQIDLPFLARLLAVVAAGVVLLQLLGFVLQPLLLSLLLLPIAFAALLLAKPLSAQDFALLERMGGRRSRFLRPLVRS